MSWQLNMPMTALSLVLLSSCHGKPHTEAVAKPEGTAYPVEIHQPPMLGAVEVSTANGHAERIICDTCHSLRQDRPLPKAVSDFKEFHLGLEFQHGQLSCAACHVNGKSSRLHLATGEVLPMTEVMQLCAQCHGRQYENYQRGSHGGMNGHWDLKQGPQLRNHCVDCHHPHQPQIQPVMPAAPPRDRFFAQGHSQ